MTTQLGAILADTRARVQARDTSDWIEKERILLEGCHPKQRGFVLDDSLKIAALVGRGGGKTTGGRARLLRKMMRTPRAKCLYIATTRDQALELMWNPLKDLIAKFQIAATFNETALRCTLTKNKASVRLVGADDKKQIEKYRGQPFHEVGIDECASYPTQLLEHLIERVIEPRLGDYNGCIWLIGTPGHILSGPFYDATMPGSAINERWEDREQLRADGIERKEFSFHSWTLPDGAPYVPALRSLWERALKKKEIRQWGDSHALWMREYLGQWAADDTEHVLRFRSHLDDGSEWNQWSPERDPRTGIAVLPEQFKDWRHVIGMDVGHADPFALCVLAWSPSDPSKTLYQRWEYSQKGMYARAIADLLIGEGRTADNPGGLIGEIGWPDAIVADAAGFGDAFLDELANVYGIRVVAAEKKNRFDAIELSNGDLVDGRIKILDRSVLKEQALHCQWAVDEFGKMSKHKGQRDDMLDAFVYARRAAQHLLAQEGAPPVAKQLSEFHDIENSELSRRGEFDDILGDDSYEISDWG